MVLLRFPIKFLSTDLHPNPDPKFINTLKTGWDCASNIYCEITNVQSYLMELRGVSAHFELAKSTHFSEVVE